MKIASLDPYLTDLLLALGALEHLCAVASPEDRQKSSLEPPALVRPLALGQGQTGLETRIAAGIVDLRLLKQADPDLVVTSLPASSVTASFDLQSAEDSAGLELSELLGHTVRLRIFNPQSLEGLLAGFERLGIESGYASKGRELAQRARAQMMDWSDNFYDRTHNKRVTLLSSVEPFALGGLWLPDIIRLASAVPQEAPVAANGAISFADIKTFRPDVLIIAPRGKTLEQSARLFRYFESLPDFGDIPAAKRGEVFFADGLDHFYQPTLQIIDSAAIIISAIAALDSGYITKRDSFYRLRWLELHRHKFT